MVEGCWHLFKFSRIINDNIKNCIKEIWVHIINNIYIYKKQYCKEPWQSQSTKFFMHIRWNNYPNIYILLSNFRAYDINGVITLEIKVWTWMCQSESPLESPIGQLGHAWLVTSRSGRTNNSFQLSTLLSDFTEK